MGSTRLTGRAILVVEDEPLIALSLRDLFEEEGATVSIANTPKDALRELEEGVFSAAVLDFGSMEADTVLLSRTLRASRIPFMYYTGHGDLDAAAIGAPVVSKPASGQILVTTLARLLTVRNPPHGLHQWHW
jgi:DNA-binding response OmpR family regulator